MKGKDEKVERTKPDFCNVRCDEWTMNWEGKQRNRVNVLFYLYSSWAYMSSTIFLFEFLNYVLGTEPKSLCAIVTQFDQFSNILPTMSSETWRTIKTPDRVSYNNDRVRSAMSNSFWSPTIKYTHKKLIQTCNIPFVDYILRSKIRHWHSFTSSVCKVQ